MTVLVLEALVLKKTDTQRQIKVIEISEIVLKVIRHKCLM